ncbi:uncharacterized protein VP01_1901g4 [Puccinia sorghi]|uniref:Uncharacterized protein n=1 Tax=Puccinia sorghi TaxID=27349 RepID=A0A0L6VCR8_9BASI|nr:uncharacterized protein VP01_1901g4 [Puccinia sorghi]
MSLIKIQSPFYALILLNTCLRKVNATLTPLVEYIFLQILVPPSPNMSRSQLFKNISIQLSAKQNVSPRRPGVVSRPGNPSYNDILAALDNICHGNNLPPPHVFARIVPARGTGSLTAQCSAGMCFSCRGKLLVAPLPCMPNLLPPQTPGRSASVYARPPPPIGVSHQLG